MSKSTSRFIPVFVNAGDLAVRVARRDGLDWDCPVFVNVPNGVREGLLLMLAKGADGKATNNILWDLPKAMLVSGIIAKGDNAGKPKFTVTITKDFLAEWLEQLAVVARGTVDNEVESLMGTWLAKSRPASVEMDVESF
jgi:hypothetical protein